MTYKSQGKRSMAWWLQAVKWFGKDGNKGIMRGAEVPTHQVKFAMQDLIARRYIQKTGGGRGKRDLAYHLTESGGRYLNDHPDELTDALPDRDQPKLPPSNAGKVPSYPDKPMRSIPMSDDRPQPTAEALRPDPKPAAELPANEPTPVSDPDPEIVRHGVSEEKAALNTPDNASGSIEYTLKVTSELVDLTENVDIQEVQSLIAQGNRLYQVLAFPEINKLIFILGRIEESK